MKLNSNVITGALIVSLGGFLFGFDTAVISGAEKQIQELFSLSPFWHGVTISSALIGTVTGALFSGRPADRYGRKPLLFIIAGLYVLTAVGSGVAPNVALFIFFRFIGGIGVGASSVVAPMYIAETSPAQHRGRMTSMFQFNVILGITVAYISNFLLRDFGEEPWRWMLGIAAIPALLYLLLLFRIPESPRFLIKTGNVQQAKKVMLKLGEQDIDDKLEEIEGSIKSSQVNEGLLSGRYNKPLIIAFLVAMFNQFSGINAILYYAPRIFELSGLSNAESLFQSIIVGITMGISTIAGMILIDRTGRKKLLITGSLGMSLSLALVAMSFYQGGHSGLMLLGYLIAYILFFGFSTGAVIWVLIAEIFPNNVRGKGQSFGSFTHWFFAALITFAFPLFAKGSGTGVGHTFLFFALMMIVQAFVTWRYFPETKGKTLEQINEAR
ncbi:MAG TPA: sugar porter family MFS transporter [Agriterribacter sp.]|mgnify:CR=1 FL=1|nr:sugar porter family MFS transporter [Agriterribacter sp.]